MNQFIIFVILYCGHAQKQVGIFAPISPHVGQPHELVFFFYVQGFSRLQKVNFCLSLKSTIWFVNEPGSNYDSDVVALKKCVQGFSRQQKVNFCLAHKSTVLYGVSINLEVHHKVCSCFHS